MTGMEWRQVPVGLDAERWITRTGCKTVLAVAHTVTSGQRLIDVVRLLESDLRIQVVFTAAPDVFSNGVSELLRDLGGVVISWEQATRMVFDLALAAAYGSVHELHAPVIVMPHGAGYNKLAVRHRMGGATAARGVYGLDPQSIIRGGSVVPAAIVLSHQADLAVLGHQCPEALPVAVVAGDPCYDRILASSSHRAVYRRALGVNHGQKLIVTVSTWGSRSLFGQALDLIDRILTELPQNEYRIITLMHPNVWFGHGPRQVRAWLTGAVERGLKLIPPSSDWMGPLIAADLIIGDHGSVAVYGAAANVPVILAGFPSDDVSPASASALLAASAPRLREDIPLTRQFADAQVNHQTQQSELVAERITSEPGRFNQNTRRLMYRILGISQPATIPAMPPAEIPVLVT
ncbi:MAG TPA: hypothetical protein VF070_49515 [Streptosporangiaceae bacterium]